MPTTRSSRRRPRRCRASLALARLALATLAIGAAACGSPPDLDKQLATVRSWSATMTLAREQRASGAITAILARQLHDRASKALGRSRSALARAAATPEERRRADASLDSLDLAVRALDAGAASR
jgi:hypothetical protein